MLQYVVTQCCKSHAYHPWARSMLFVSVASGFLRERVLPNIPWFWFILWILERKGRLLGPFIAGRCLGIWPARQRKGIKMSLMRVELKNQIILSRPDNIYRLACIRPRHEVVTFLYREFNFTHILWILISDRQERVGSLRDRTLHRTRSPSHSHP